MTASFAVIEFWEQLDDVAASTDHFVVFDLTAYRNHADDLLGGLHIAHQCIRDILTVRDRDHPFVDVPARHCPHHLEQGALAEVEVGFVVAGPYQASREPIRHRVCHQLARLLGALNDDLNPKLWCHRLSIEHCAGEQFSEKPHGLSGGLLSGYRFTNGGRRLGGDHTEATVIGHGPQDPIVALGVKVLHKAASPLGVRLTTSSQI